MTLHPLAPKRTIGWQEWCALPALGLPLVKAKADTGARTSAIHAVGIKPCTGPDGTPMVRFRIHPLPGRTDVSVACAAPLVGERAVTSSNGECERRPVIRTTLALPGAVPVEVEISLTMRHKMAFRMLLGRSALRRARLIVDARKGFLLGQHTEEEVAAAHDIALTPKRKAKIPCA